MDTEIFYYINRELQNSFFDMLMPFVTEQAYIPFLLIIIPAFIKDVKKALIITFLCIIAVAIGDMSANLLKHLFERPRPCLTLKDIRLLVGCGGSFSMPSNHAVNAFVVAATFSHFFRKATIPMFTFAVTVAFSRVYVGVHYPSDVLVGAIWGGIVSGCVIFLSLKLKPHFISKSK